MKFNTYCGDTSHMKRPDGHITGWMVSPITSIINGVEMTKNYIKDNGRVRLCPSNIAKMNIFESMYYHRFRMWENIVDVTGDLIENLYLIRELFILLILPLAYPYMAWQEVQHARKDKARKDMERFNNVSTE